MEIYKKMEILNNDLFDDGNPTIIILFAYFLQIFLSPVWFPIYLLSKWKNIK